MTIEDIISKVQKYRPQVDGGRLRQAYLFAVETHQEKKCFCGQFYPDYLLSVLDILLEFRPDEDSLVACLLSEIWREGNLMPRIEERFGSQVTMLVGHLSKMNLLSTCQTEAEQVSNLRKLFLAMAHDTRVILIKLARRLHRMRNGQNLSPEVRQRFAKETMYIYAPVAARLGIYNMKSELEDLAFEILWPIEFNQLSQQLDEYIQARQQSITQIKKVLEDMLAREDISGRVVGRVKHLYSIYQKLKRKNQTLVSDVLDIFAMRIILPDEYRNNIEFVGHCYHTLGVLHHYFVPLGQRFKDYVAVPKINRYRSLHTTVMGLGGKLREQPTEVQIRTEAMDQEAQYGVAAHWAYDEAKLRPLALSSINERGRLNSLDRHVPMTASFVSPADFLSEVAEWQNQEDGGWPLDTILADRIFVLTPRGEIKDLPNGATPVDFAYAVHTEVGHCCHRAKINGELVSLDYPLQNGQVVEILTKKEPNPSRFWLSFVKTPFARFKIKTWFRYLDRERNRREGKLLLNEQLAKLGKPLLDPGLTLLRRYDGQRLSIKDREELLEKIGSGQVPVTTILKKMFSPHELAVESILPKPSVAPRMIEPLEKSILVRGEQGLPIKLAACCHPVSGQPIVGYVTRGKGITIHRTACLVLENLEANRLIEADWKNTPQLPRYPVKIQIDFQEREGILSTINKIFYDLNLNILDFNSERRQRNLNSSKFLEIVLEVTDYDELNRLLYRLEQVEGITGVRRMGK